MKAVYVSMFIMLFSDFKASGRLLDRLVGWGAEGGWNGSIQSLDVLYSGNFQYCCDYIEEIALTERKNGAVGTTTANRSEGERYIESKRAREICVLSCLYPRLLLYLTHTKIWRYNPLLQQKETLYSSFLYRRVALGGWASVALGTCRLEHKSEAVCVCVCVSVRDSSICRCLGSRWPA
jgi:hypothetical protein